LSFPWILLGVYVVANYTVARHEPDMKSASQIRFDS
jgi:hypothetical protein